MSFLGALLLGIVAGLRTFTPLAVVSWAARTGNLAVSNSPMAFMGYRYTPIVLTVLAVVELILDKLPSTGSRKKPGPFAARIVSGALCGAAVGATQQLLLPGLALGAVGAILGTLGGAAIRAKMAAAFGRDLPAALIEDSAAIAIAVASVVLRH